MKTGVNGPGTTSTGIDFFTATEIGSAEKDSSAASDAPVLKRGRGRPSKASLAAAAAAKTASRSSVATSTYESADSASGYSTPLTSNVTTPAPSLLTDKSKPASARSARSTKIEVLIPMRNTRESANMIQKAKDYMNKNASMSKRKRDVIADSEEDDFADGSPNAGRTRHDEKIARQLQEELDREAAEAVDALISGDDDGVDYGTQQLVMAPSDSEDYPMADRKGKGKAIATRRPRASRAAAEKYIVTDSDEDPEDDDYSDPGDIEPPAKKQKIVLKGRGKQASAKGKGKQPAGTLSESDDDVSGMLYPSFLKDFY